MSVLCGQNTEITFTGNVVLGLKNFTCYGLDAVVGFYDNNLRFHNIRKYLDVMNKLKKQPAFVFLCSKENLCTWTLLVMNRHRI
jgi:hypothetical protein